VTDRNSRVMYIVGAMLGAVVLLPYLEHVHRFELAYPILVVGISILGVVWVSPELRGQLWFWATIVVVAALHVPLIIEVPWRAGWLPAPVILAFCIADALIFLGIIRAIQKLKDGAKTSA
jgi:hypothetical protein